VQKFKKINAKLFTSAWMSQFLSGLMMPIMNFVGNLGLVGVSVLGGWLAIQGKIKIGDIQAFIQYVNQFNQPIVQSANIANVMQSTAAAGERVFEFLDEKEESPKIKKQLCLMKLRAGLNLIMWFLDTIRIRLLSRASTPKLRPAKESPLSAQPAPEKLRS